MADFLDNGAGNQSQSTPLDLTEIEAVLDHHFANADITESARTALKAKLREVAKPAQQAPPPQPRQQQPPPPSMMAPAVPMPPQYQQAEIERENLRGQNAMNAVEMEYVQKYPADWAKIRPLVVAELKKFDGAPPAQWANILRQSAELVIANKLKRAAPPAAQPQSIRPSGTVAQTGTKPTTGKAAAFASLTRRSS